MQKGSSSVCGRGTGVWRKKVILSGLVLLRPSRWKKLLSPCFRAMGLILTREIKAGSSVSVWGPLQIQAIRDALRCPLLAG
jgi:hypothetical protein